MIVIDDEKAENQQAGKNTANDFADSVEIPESATDGRGEEKSCGGETPPASARKIAGIRFGSQNKVRPCSHQRSQVKNLGKITYLSIRKIKIVFVEGCAKSDCKTLKQRDVIWNKGEDLICQPLRMPCHCTMWGS